MPANKNIPFSSRLEAWLKDDQPKTLEALQEVFHEKSFAMFFLVLMFIPSLPIPTGGFTHALLEPVVFLLSLEMFFGRRTIWLPKKLKKRSLGKVLEDKALPFILKRVRWFEKYSRPRLGWVLDKTVARSLIALIVFTFTLGAFASPPFSGLDTLPSMGVVIIALAMILDDIVLMFIGLLVGSVGMALIFASGAAISSLFSQIIN